MNLRLLNSRNLSYPVSAVYNKVKLTTDKYMIILSLRFIIFGVSVFMTRDSSLFILKFYITFKSFSVSHFYISIEF